MVRVEDTPKPYSNYEGPYIIEPSYSRSVIEAFKGLKGSL